MVFFYFYFVIINLVGDGMNINSIESLLKKKSNSIKEKNILKDFPSIVNDLETIVNIFNKEIEGVTVNQMVCPVYNIELYKTEFLAELMKKYMEFTWQDKFGYEIDDMIFMISSGGYNKKKDIVLLSPLALLLNAGSNTSSALARIIHEYRHQHQFHFFHESDIKKIIKYPSHYMLLTKNRFVKDIHDIYDEDCSEIDFVVYNPIPELELNVAVFITSPVETLPKKAADLYAKFIKFLSSRMSLTLDIEHTNNYYLDMAMSSQSSMTSTCWDPFPVKALHLPPGLEMRHPGSPRHRRV